MLRSVFLCSRCFSQTDRHSPLLGVRARPSLDSGKMRASVRMTRYLESWGAAKPFANLHHRDSMTTDNGKINTRVSVAFSQMRTQRFRYDLLMVRFFFQDVPMGQYHFQMRRERLASGIFMTRDRSALRTVYSSSYTEPLLSCSCISSFCHSL